MATNAVHHGRAPGRDFHVRLIAPPANHGAVIRIEVSDTPAEKLPALTTAGPDAETGRGLYLVSQLAERRAVSPRPGGAPGKTVWAEISIGTKPSDSC
ncbi:ATP-binding protein [Streptomyces sp. NPDC007917]|uniref:ATP-binding protein n=1 Tax=Streptomyces sp. NPDC007917 TaxID=3364793 RepID=UPI0036E55AC4